MVKSNALLHVSHLTVKWSSFGITILMWWAVQLSKKWRSKSSAAKTRSKNSCSRMLYWPENASASKKPRKNLANTVSIRANAASARMIPWELSKLYSVILMETTVFHTLTVRDASTNGPSDVWPAQPAAEMVFHYVCTSLSRLPLY